MTWDAQRYDAQFGFVTAGGAGVLDLLAARPGERVLDLGCGTGHQAAGLAELGVAVTAVDADEAMVARARIAHPSLTVMVADGQRLDAVGLESGFDAVLSNAALHWMPDQAAVLSGVHALLRPGGRFACEQGGAGNVARVWEALRSAFTTAGLTPPTCPWTFPTPAEQARRLEDAGFVVRMIGLLNRPTSLGAGRSVRDWVEMFAGAALDPWPDAQRQVVLSAVDTHARAAGLANLDGWWADYVRLRFLAEKC